MTTHEDRMVLARPAPDGAARFKLVERLLESLARETAIAQPATISDVGSQGFVSSDWPAS